MADDKKNIPEAAPPTEAPAPAVENAAVLEQPSPGPALTDAEAVMLEHEWKAVLFEMGEAVPDPADAVTHAEVEEPAAPEVPKAEKEQEQPLTPGKDDSTPAHSGKVVDFAAARCSSRNRPSKVTRPPSPAEADRPRRTRLLPIRPSSPNLGTKSPKVRLPRRSLSRIKVAFPPVRRSRRSHLRPVTPIDR